MSIPASIWKVVIPVSRSPRMIAHAIGRRAAIPREQRRVDVDRPARGHVENGAREDLAERHHDRDVGRVLGETLGPAGIAEPGRLEHRDPLLEREPP